MVRELARENYVFIVVAKFHQMRKDLRVFLGHDGKQALNLEDFDHAVAVHVPPLQFHAYEN